MHGMPGNVELGGQPREVTLTLPTTAPAIVLPNAAVRRWQGRTGVWTVQAGALGFAPVRLGETSLDGRVQVLGEPSGVDGGTTRDNFWLTSILVDPTVAGFSAEDLRLVLAAADIEARPLWKPMHLQPVFAFKKAYVDGTSERLFRTGLSLPSGSALTDEQMDRIDVVVARFLRELRVGV